jgi:hypothetical protein
VNSSSNSLHLERSTTEVTAKAKRRSRDEIVAASSRATMVIAIGVARIEVRSGFDQALLTEVVEALGGAR